ncbi:MAG: RNA repair domain-containing protein [Candidatus Nanoarchaeia archaeon]
MIFDILNKLKWTGKLNEVEIIIIHRGAEKNQKIIYGSEITEIKRSHFYYKDGEKETYIPNHRVLEIRCEGKILWKKKMNLSE